MLRVVAATASYLVTSLLIKEVYLTMMEDKIEKEQKKEKAQKSKIEKEQEEEAQKKGRGGSSTGRSTPSGRLPPLDEGVDTLNPHTLPPSAMYPRAPGQNDFDEYTNPLLPPHK